MQMLLEKNDILRLIEPHYPNIVQLIQNASERLRFADKERHCLEKRTVANIYRDLAVDEARQVFSGKESHGISLLDLTDSSFYIEISGYPIGIQGAVWLRIKKINDEFLTSNIPTKKSNNYNSQKSIDFSRQPYLEGEEWGINEKILKPTYANIGHKWDETNTKIENLLVTVPETNNSLYWYEQIADAEIIELGLMQENNVSNFPIRLEVTNQKPRRVSAKKENNSKEKVKKDGTKG
jgi:hypothetical protein